MTTTQSLTISLEDLRTLPLKYDVFICSASYEERCTSIANAVADHPDVVQRFVCFNQRSSSLVVANAKKLLDRLGPKAEGIPLDKVNPLATADSLQKAMSRIGADDARKSYLVDITTFTHESLLILLRVLQSRASMSTVCLAYAPADEYSLGLREEDKWLSKGITDIRSVLGYPGDNKPSRKSHLIVLVGFESDRAERLIDEYQPHIISLGFCTLGSSTALQHEAVNRQAFQRLAAKTPRYYEFEFSCVDIDAVEASVSAQAVRFPESNVVIAPMNTKLSTVGVAGVAFRDTRVQLCYASASQYNVEAYSRPGTTCVLTKLEPGYWRAAG